MSEHETTETEQKTPRTGKFLGMPYDWRRPTRDRLRSRMWNPDDKRIFTPKTFGWGFDVNFYRLVHPRTKTPPKAD